MKTTLTLFTLITSFILGSSFKVQDDDDKYKVAFKATIDGSAFALKEEQLFRGLLMNKAGSMDGKIPARTVISANFSGPDDLAAAKGLPAENASFEIDYTGDNTGKATNYNITLQHNGQQYTALKESSEVYITALVWESDRKHFLMCAMFDCKMRGTDSKKTISLKGEMKNIRVTVPGWLAAKI